MKIAIDINDVYRDFTKRFGDVFTKEIDSTFELDERGVFSAKLDEVFPFSTREEYITFRYEDYAYELYCRCELCDKNLMVRLNRWMTHTLDNLDTDEKCEVSVISCIEHGMTIPATMSFLAGNPLQCKEFYFPSPSDNVWDRYDVIITADPYVIDSKPEGKFCVKINTSYNKDSEADLSYDSITEIIDNDDNGLIKYMEGKNDE